MHAAAVLARFTAVDLVLFDLLRLSPLQLVALVPAVKEGRQRLLALLGDVLVLRLRAPVVLSLRGVLL